MEITKVKLYHGTSKSFEYPDISKGRIDCDFGQGFYLTTSRNQALNWAIRNKKLFGAGYIYTYEINDLNDLRCLNISEDMDEWLKVVSECRLSKSEDNSYSDIDIIFGKVLDGKNFLKILLEYEEGKRKSSEVIHDLKLNVYKDQIAIKTNKGLSKVRFINKEEI